MRYVILLATLLSTQAYAQPKINAREAKCLATTIYGEARGESIYGKLAVAYTVINRAVSTTICKVVLAPYQYSIYNDNPALRMAATTLKIMPPDMNVIDKISWKEAYDIATAVLSHQIDDPTNGATHYVSPVAMKAQKLVYPPWTHSYDYKLTAVIENHRFYRYVERKVDPVNLKIYLDVSDPCVKVVDSPLHSVHNKYTFY